MEQLTPKYRVGQRIYIIPKARKGIVDKVHDLREKYPKYPFKYDCSYEEGKQSISRTYEEHEIESI